MHPTIVADEETHLLPDNQITDTNQGLCNQPFRVYLVAGMAAIGGFLFGYDTGIVSGAMLYITNEFKLDDVWHEAVVSSTLLTAWLFSILSGSANDVFGRKPVIIFSSVVFVVGSALLAIAFNKWILIAGRLIVGAGVGIASMTAPMYIAELAPAPCRGQLLLIFTASITGGAFIAALAAFALSYVPEYIGWRIMVGIAALPALIQLLAFSVLPESPRWLVAQQRFDKAIEVLRALRNKDANVDAEFVAICKSNSKAKRQRQDLLNSINMSNNGIDIETNNNNNNESAAGQQKSVSTFRRILAHESCRRALVVGCLLQLVQQLAGINTIMYYSASIIEMSGVKDKSVSLLVAAALAFVNFIGTLAGFVFVERSGRRKLVLISLSGVTLSLFSTGLGFQLQQNIVLIIASMVVYLGFFSPGMGPMPWTINSEIYPSWARPFCMSTATSVCWAANLLVSMTFLSLGRAITECGAYYLYATFSFLGLLFFAIFLPETRGKSLEQLENLFASEKTKRIEELQDE